MMTKRVNVRITEKMDEWFNNRSKETGVAKSSLMALALEQHIIERQALNDMSAINKLIELQQQASVEKKD